MKNRILFVVFLLMTSVSAMGFTIDSLNLEFRFTYLDNQEVVSVKASETKPEGDLVIPSTVEYDGETYTVAFIKPDAFRECNGLTSVIIPNSVRTIGDYAFADCKNLTSVVIGDSVQIIYKKAFSGCSSLTKVEFASLESLLKIEYDGYDANPMRYAKSLYMNGKEVSELIIPNTIKKINDYAFINCQSLTSVVIGDSVKSIGEYAFEICYNLKPVIIPETVSTIGDWAFYCVKSIVYSGNAEGRSWGAFTVNGIIDGDFVYSDIQKTKLLAYTGDGGDVVIPDAVVEIGDWAFYCCTNLKSVTIPNAVDIIGYEVFRGCTATLYCNVEYRPGGWDIEWCGKEYKGEIVWKTSTPVTETAANAVSIYAYGNSIVVENAAEEISVYDVMGKLICRDAINRVPTEIPVNTTGVYIVKVGGVVKRVVVR